MKAKDFAKIFFVTLIAHLAFLAKADDNLIILTKILLPISLASYFYSKTRLKETSEKWIFLGLMLCFLGHSVFNFMAGTQLQLKWAVVVFFAAHVVYAIGFILENQGQKGIVEKFIVPGILPIAAGFIMCWNFWTQLDHYKIPVVLYALSYTFLAATALNRTAATRSYSLVAFAAFLLFASDYLMGYHTFLQPISNATFFISASYYVGQFCLVLGVVVKKGEIE